MLGNNGSARSFGASAGAYERGRPGYPAAAVEWLLDPLRGAAHRPRVADVGAGTGKLTRALLGAGCEVVAVDPDTTMLRTLRALVPDVPALAGTAESLPLADACVDAVVLGQAWHWVDPARGSSEIARVLRPGGVLGLVWNLRDESDPWVARLNALMPKGGAVRMLAGNGPRVDGPFAGLEERRWPWVRAMTRGDLMDMMRSRSFFITATPERRASYERELAALLDEVDPGARPTIGLPYLTTAFRTRRADPGQRV